MSHKSRAELDLLCDQPEEIVIEQLRYLPLEDLSRVCSTNLQMNRICQGRRLWEFRLIDDFKVRDLSRVQNSRDYYFYLLQERQNILDFILGNITQEFFNQNMDAFIDQDIHTYQQFTRMQRDATGKLTEQEIDEIKLLQRLFPKLMSFDIPDGGSSQHITTFFFDLFRGQRKIVLTETQF